MKGFRFAAVLAAVFCLGLAGPVLAAPITTTWTWGGTDYNWGAAANWNSGVPNNTAEDKYTAVINDNHNILVNGTYTIETLQNNGLGVLTIGTYQRLGLDSGASSVNNGTIKLEDTSSGTTNYAFLDIYGAVGLGGTGTIEFASAYQNRIVDRGSGHLTLGSGQTIRTSGTLGHQGDIMVALTNNGTVQADNGTVTLSRASSNNNLMEAVNAGLLVIDGVTLTNSSGTLTAQTGSTVKLDGATVIGGTLNGPGDFEISGTNNTLDGTGGLVMASNFLAGTYDYLYLKGDVTNNGRIELNDASSTTTNYALLYSTGAVNLGGTGTIEFASAYQNRLYAGTGGYLNLGSGQTVKTTGTGSQGDIYVGLTNEGLISANNGTISLLSADKTNNNRIEAVNNGRVNIDGITLTNTGGEVYVDGTSTVKLDGATVIGGTLNGPGDFEISGTNNTLDGTGGLVMASNFLAGTYDYLYLKGDVTNNGRIELNDASSTTTNYALLYSTGAVNLGGTGTIEFASAYQNRLYAGTGGYLNLGSGQTVKTTGTGSQGDIYVGLTNEGLIRADNGVITLLSADKTNNNRIEAINGSQLNINNITLTNTGGEVYVDGTSTLQLSSATVAGGTIGGNGVVNIAATSTLDGTGGGLTINPDTKLGTYYYLYLKGDITNNGRIELNDASVGTTNYSILYAYGTVNLGGTGSVEFASDYQNRISDGGGSGHLIVGPDQTITAGSGTSGTIYVPTTVNGTVQAAGGSLSLPTNLTNHGLVRSANGSTLNVNNAVGGTGGWTADGGTLNVNANVSTTGAINVINAGHLLVNGVTMTGSNLFVDAASSFAVSSGLGLTGDFGFALTDETNWVWGSSSSLALNGLGADQQSLEIGGHDYGLDAAGFSANFDLPNLVIEGGGTYTYLADLFDNGNRASPEALYVDDLDVLVGATLNLNGLNLYTWLDDEIHLVAAGEGDLFGGGLIIDEEVSAPVPLPGSVWLLAGGLIGLLGLKRRNSRQSG